jgi:hypothetical protein
MGLTPLLATSVATSLGMVRIDPPNLIILDLGLPDGDGSNEAGLLLTSQVPYRIERSCQNTWFDTVKSSRILLRALNHFIGYRTGRSAVLKQSGFSGCDEACFEL